MLEPMSTTFPGTIISMRFSICCSMRETVSVEKSGWLKSGHCSVNPRTASRSARNCAFVDIGEEAKPWR